VASRHPRRRRAGHAAAGGDLLIYALTDAGLYIADKRTGSVLEYFDPGDGVSADPVSSTIAICT
jgi:hypothetical protein